MPNEPSTLVCWIGATDLRASQGRAEGVGPIAQAVDDRRFGRIFLLSDFSKEKAEPYVAWLADRTEAGITLKQAVLTSPVAITEVYEQARTFLEEVTESRGDMALTFHLSPGTWAMATAWFILAKTRFPAELIQSSIEKGVGTAVVPFDLAADFLPDLLAEADAKLRDRAEQGPPSAPEFGQILHRSKGMARVIRQAKRVAVRNVPVLLRGESGTGKELFARAIHRASNRGSGPFVPVNCGAIPENLVEAELFGHTKAAFTGATSARKGHFREANGGTLFLDEIAELPRISQVKLLRVLQEREVTPVGASKPMGIDVRIVCATHADLFEAAAAGAFRTDLLYRLAVAVLTLPPLRERPGDITLLAQALLKDINEENQDQPNYEPRTLTAGAKNLLNGHHWPGNVRELQNTLQRAALWSEGPNIGTADAREALAAGHRGQLRGVLERPLDDAFDLHRLLDEVSKPYLERAMAQTGGNKTQAAKLLGLKSHQVLTSRLRKLGLE